MLLPSFYHVFHSIKARQSNVKCSHIKSLQLADPQFMADPVELLLSAEMYSVILQEDLRKGAPQAPVAQRMLLRWILSEECGDNSTIILRRFFQCIVNHELNALMQCFWEQERETPAALTQRSSPVRSFLKLTRAQLSAGTLCALCLSAINSQGHSRQPAEQLLLAMEQRCEREAQFGNLYRNFLKEYEELNHGIRAEISQSRRARKVLSIYLTIECCENQVRLPS